MICPIPRRISTRIKMMWSPAILLLLVGATFATPQTAWKNGKEYTYKVRSRTLTAFNPQSKQYAGILIEAHLTVQPNGQMLRAKVSQPRYAQINARLENGWDTELPPGRVNLQNFPLSQESFEIKMKNGVVQDLIVNKNVPTWEVNILKSFVSQLQVDTEGENAEKSKHNQFSEGGQPNALFKTMEDSVGGKCEVLYDISPVPESMIQNNPEIAPMPELREDGDMISVVKTKNYSNCAQRVSYHYGLGEKGQLEPSSNDAKGYLSRSSVSRIVISGNLKKFTIQSSVTTNKVVLKSDQQENQQGLVASKIKLTLHRYNDVSDQISPPENPQSTGNLVYNYNNPFESESSRRPNHFSSKTNSRNSKEKERRKNSGENSNESGSDSSESVGDNDGNSYYQLKPELTQPPPNPLLPYFVGNGGRSIQANDRVDVVKSAKRIAQEIGNDMEKPDMMPEFETLEKFSILTRLIRTMSAEQIDQVQRDVYESPKSSNHLHQNNESHNARRKAWAAFRDAVAQAGTGAALVNIKKWIENKEIQGSEAASVIVTAGNSAQIPTPEYVDAFFDIASMQETKNQPFLREAAIYAFSDLVRHSIVNKRSAHNRYPIHAFGNLFAEKKHRNVHEKYIPHVAEELKKAVDDGNSKKIQVYSTALGRMADPKILAVLEPYLEGKRQVSPFQRLVMVLGLSELTTTHPKIARSVLYKIYSRGAEYDEIRVAAVFLIMKTNPPVEILQRMAENTNYDSSKQVNSAVKSSIQSLAQLKSNEASEIANAARAAVPLLTPENYGLQFSRAFYKTYQHAETSSGYTVKILGSEDSIIPKGVYVNIETIYKGQKGPHAEVAATISSVRDTIELLKKIAQGSSKKSEKEQQKDFSPENLAKLLDIQGKEPNQVEGFVFSNSQYGMNFLAFDNHSLENLPEQIKEMKEAVKRGEHIDITKFRNHETTIGFPTETGLPFVMTLKVPSVMNVEGQVKGKIEDDSSSESKGPKSAKVNGQARIVYGMKIQQRMGFVAPFERQEYLAGVDKNLQVHVPVRAEVQYDKSKKEVSLKVQPQEDAKDVKVFQFKTEPFTSKYDIISLKPVTKDKNTHIIRKENTKTSQIVFEDSNNKQKMEISVEKESKQMGADNTRRESKEQAAMLIMADLSQSLSSLHSSNSDSDEYEKFSIKVSPSSEARAEIKLSVDSMISEKNSNDDSEDYSPNAKAIHLEKNLSQQERKERLLQEVSKNINNAKADVIDVSLEVNESRKFSLGLTAAVGRSNVDQKSRAAVFVVAKDEDEDEEYHLSAALETKNPNIESMDYEQTLKFNTRREFDAEIHYGKSNGDRNKNKIKIQGMMKQSEERKNLIRHSREAEACRKQEMQDSNKLTAACQKANKRASSLDKGEVVITFENESKVKEAAMGLIDAAHSMTQDYVESQKNHQDKEESNKIKVTFDESPNEELEITVRTPEGKIKINNIKLGSRGQNYGDNEKSEDNENNESKMSLSSTCSLDKSEIKSFDGHRYPASLGRCWHVAFTSFSKKDADRADQKMEIPNDIRVSVLTKETENGQKEMKVTLGEKEVKLSPSSESDSKRAQVSVDGKEIELSRRRSHQEMRKGEVVLEVFELPDKSVKLVSDKYDVEIVYDGSRAQIKAGDKYRDAVRGLCGNYDGESSNDQQTPKGCLLQKPEEFTATFALTSEGQCEGPSVQNSRKAKNSQCTFDSRQPGNVISDQEAGRSGPRGSSHDEEGEHSCMRHRTMVTRSDSQICFSLRPLPKCASGCKPTSLKNKDVQFHCVPRTSAAEKVADRVERGANPDLSMKAPSKTEKHSMPLSCTA